MNVAHRSLEPALTGVIGYLPMGDDRFEHDFKGDVLRLHRTLERFGWAYSPTFTLGMDFNDLQAYAKSVKRKPPSDPEASRTIHRMLFKSTGSPRYRAYYLYRATILPHLKEFAHYFEAGQLLYFRREYLPAILTMLPSFEGVLRAYAGLGTDALIPDVFGAIKARPAPPSKFHAGRFQMHRAILIKMLSKWLYRSIDDAAGAGNFDVTHLNRNRDLHLFAPDRLFTAADAMRLLLLFDLFVETLAHDTEEKTSCFLPDLGKNPFVDARSEHYVHLLLGDVTVGQARDTERKFMAEHPNYQLAEPFEPLSAIIEDTQDYHRRTAEAIAHAREQYQKATAAPAVS
jgi:hypothetical protein